MKIYCTSCEKVTEHRQKLHDTVCNKCDICNYPVFLKRIGDVRSNVGNKIVWIEWTEEGFGKAIHQDPQVGFSLCLDPHTIKAMEESVSSYRWMTTGIVEILEDKKTKGHRKVHFKTKNSEYVLHSTIIEK